MTVLIVGAGIFGVSTAVELARRGHTVTLADPGPCPHPLAASTDISKVVRMEYGADVQYMIMAESAIEGWHAWNEEFPTPLYHESGVTMLTRGPMAPGGFEFESLQTLLARGHRPERLSQDDIQKRFPAWSEQYVDGFFHAVGGFAESGRVVAHLIEIARGLGVKLRLDSRITDIIEQNGRAIGARTEQGNVIHTDQVLIAAGTWTPMLVPELKSMMKSTGHPVFHLQINDRDRFSPPQFATFMADVASSGWYGFPLHPNERVLKLANHGIGLKMGPDDHRVVTEADDANLRSFLKSTFPDIADAPIVYRRRCLYSDTLDEHFLIDHHPEKPGLAVAAGGSGHGFKFGPILGGLIADMIDGTTNTWLERFKWRRLDEGTQGQEAARFHG